VSLKPENWSEYMYWFWFTWFCFMSK